jgi:BRCA1/BRCA2-containing complex subunit 3
VVGWYHSHPHITIHPSHVDLSTQQLYQHLDSRFVGLIVSAFDKSRGKIGFIAFQSGPQSQEVVIPIQFLPNTSDPTIPLLNMVKLVQIQASEEREAYCAAVGAPESSTESTTTSSSSSSSGSTTATAAPHPLVSTFAAATYQRSLVRLLEIQVAPVITALDEQLSQSNARLAQLRTELAAVAALH